MNSNQRRMGINKYTTLWTQEEIDLLRRVYPNKNISSQEIGRMFGRNFGTIGKKASSLGLKRNIPVIRMCDICKKHNTPRGWYKHNGGRICSLCWKKLHYRKRAKIRTKKLSKTSATGKGFIGEQVVCKYLCVENNNIEQDMFAGNAVDIFHKTYGKINVKGRKKSWVIVDGIKYYLWSFKFMDMDIIDTYFLLGFDEDRKNIIRAWIIPKKELKNKWLYIFNSAKSELKHSKYAIDAEPLNRILHSLGKSECKYLCDVN